MRLTLWATACRAEKEANGDGAGGAGDGEAEEKQEFKREMTPGSLLELTGLGAEEDRFVIKEFLSGYAEVKYVDIDDEAHTAVVRFENADGAKSALAAVQATIGKEKKELAVTGASILEGDAERL